MATASFITSHPELVNWTLVLNNRKQYNCLINAISNARIDWYYVTEENYNNFTEDFIRLFYDKLNWNAICWRMDLSEDLLREFKDYVKWDAICMNKNRSKLSREFILEFRDKVNWNALHSRDDYQDLLELELELDVNH